MNSEITKANEEISDCWNFINNLYSHPLNIWCDAAWCPKTKIAVMVVTVERKQRKTVVPPIRTRQLGQRVVRDMETNTKAEKAAVSLALEAVEKYHLNVGRSVIIKTDCQTSCRRNIESEGYKNVELKWQARGGNASHKKAISTMRALRDKQLALQQGIE